MADISAKDVMNLRNRTGLPMMACKSALGETGGDVDAAEEHLRKQLKGKMEKRTDRVAGEGRIAIVVSSDESSGAIVELRAETDFTAKNENFVSTAKKVASLVLENSSAGQVEATDGISAVIDDIRISTGENCSFARGQKVSGVAGKTSIGTYVHHDGKTGVLIRTEGSVSEETLRQICMHITAAMPRPLGVTSDDIPADMVEKERTFRTNQAIESGKPPEIAEKMVQGGMRKFFEEVALVEQPFVMDTSKKIKDVVGADARIVEFFRWQVGEET